ncbi:hypothetical protein [Methanocorpusculum vombati]|uniref:Uncharacterized protein n=1 Tax=Methanocorpusculum vombati TaxID=3002864 RepID=A0ABT4IJX5_9EURY|nr:hypothetical protein [Methanocorpusculum vombati]MCZ9312435.1 hypothetical protein [Methanocorpusculum sp.]MCZ0862040.1 hypothetical protein [Methanocorpusculum vombati]MCZ9319498.1 hypothetical protein [Methanocorpusculum sp.]MDE2520435.1 hypothetical protein [Methanocorpusculum sp.]MDE2534105.1 hypothetical protein [Methanocorpusculum sp.]
MKKITYFLIALLLCAAFVGTASAWNSNSEANINPSGNLMPGDTVSATMTIKILQDSTVYRINMYTDLTSAVWTGSLATTDGTPITEFPAGKRYIDGYPLTKLPQDTVLTIYLDGKVPDAKAGSEITVITVEEVSSSESVISTYSSKKQMVYNPDDVPKQIEEVGKAINELDAQITELSKQGADVSAAISKLEVARNDLNAADNHKTDIATASKEIISASAALVEAEKEMVNAALVKTKSNLDAIEQNIANLNAKGWNDNRVILLSNSKQTSQNLYNTAKAAYDASTSSVSATTRSQSLEALNGSVSTLETSNALWEEAQKSPLDAVGPYAMYIVIGVVAVIVIVGAIVVIRRRNENDWDELG